jgi:hypothetical protein
VRRPQVLCVPLAGLAIAGCAGLPARGTLAPLPAANDVVAVVYFVGDAGEADPLGEPVLNALEGDIAESPQGATRLLLFLGDNVYPRGMPTPGSAGRVEAERRLAAQVAVGVSTKTTTVFVPGNHDWDFSGPNGWTSVREEEAFVEARGEGLVSMLPGGGCPGPSALDVGGAARIVILDTEWWLRSGPKPTHPSSSCPADSESEVVAMLAAALDPSDGRPVFVAGHHPMLTAGTYGGHFGVRQHLFPLVDWKPWLWLPLPMIGSIYPIARQHGITEQDASGSLNRAMRESLAGAFAKKPPLAYFSGHVHALQVLDGGPLAKVLVTSGAGVYGHVSSLGTIPETLFLADGASGYARLHIERGGRVRLSIVQVDPEAGRREVYATFLDENE